MLSEEDWITTGRHAAAALSIGPGVALAIPAAAQRLPGVGAFIDVSGCPFGVHYHGGILAGWILATFVAGA
jgi:hypothetical protein